MSRMNNGCGDSLRLINKFKEMPLIQYESMQQSRMTHKNYLLQKNARLRTRLCEIKLKIYVK